MPYKILRYGVKFYSEKEKKKKYLWATINDFIVCIVSPYKLSSVGCVWAYEPSLISSSYVNLGCLSCVQGCL